MISHFVNLVSWRFFIEKNASYSHMYCDSNSLRILLNLFNCKGFVFMPGIKFRDYYLESLIEKSIFLVSRSSRDREQIVLPFFNGDEFENFDWSFIKDYSDVIIGISSPKQDALAIFLSDKFPGINFYCLGAAVYHKKLSRFLPNFIELLIFKPRRTLKKISVTILEVMRILCSREDRREFKKFVQNIERNSFEIKRL